MNLRTKLAVVVLVLLVCAGGWMARLLLSHRSVAEIQIAATMRSEATSSASDSEPDHPTRFIDLSPHFNDSLDDGWQHRLMAGNNLGTLPRGRQVFGGVEFDIRGTIQLTSRKLRQSAVSVTFPERVRGIRVGRKCRELHFLHATGWNAPPGTWVGSYFIHYADDTVEAARILYGQGTGNWWAMPTDLKRPGDGVVWQGTNSAKQPIQLFKQCWINPRPDIVIKSLDFESRLTRVAPFLIAASAK